MQSVTDLEKTTFSGRRFTRKQLSRIQETVAMFPNLSRKELAQTLCEHLGWVNWRGKNKIESCMTLLLALEKQSVIALPPKQARTKRRSDTLAIIEGATHEAEIQTSLDAIGPITLQRVITQEDRKEMKDAFRKHHYLGYRRFFGPQIVYWIVSPTLGRKLGCLVFSASAAWALAPRDQWIGWADKHRSKLLHLILNNNRFLIFPWVKIPNLATHVLSKATGQVGTDWLHLYRYRPVLIETFVDQTKYTGTCYRAANWQHIGQTQGRGREDRRSEFKETQKDIYMYPLVPNFRDHLTQTTRVSTLKKKYRNDLKLARTHSVDDAFVALWENVIHIVREVASEYDAKWQVRKRVIDSMLLILFIFRLVSSERTRSYGTTIDALWDNCQKLGLSLPQKSAASPSSFCVARKKLDEQVFCAIHQKVIENYAPIHEQRDAWIGHRLFAVDGSKMNLPRACRLSGYTVPSENAYYPQGLLSVLYHLPSKIPFDFDLTSHKNERTAAQDHLSVLQRDDVVVYDRGYFSYAMLRRHHASGIHAVFRLPDQCGTVIHTFLESNETDTVVMIKPSDKAKAKLKKNDKNIEIMPTPMRLIRYSINGSMYCLGTTLLDPRHTVQDFADVYHARWGIEELFKVSKRTFKIEDFHGKTERTVKQELFAHFLLITMNRIFANHANIEINTDSDNAKFDSSHEPKEVVNAAALQINFANCIHVFTHAMEALFVFHERLKSTVDQVFGRIAGRYFKARPGRSYERKSRKPESKWRQTKKPPKHKPTSVIVPILNPTPSALA